MSAEELIKKYTPSYLTAHPCLCGYWVISYWVRFYPDSGEAVQQGDEVTVEEADTILQEHLNNLELPHGVWTDGQREALKSIIHYMQEDWIESALKRALEASDWTTAKELWLNLGMTDWRAEEVALFFGVDSFN